ncbi:MAG: glycosyltransferase family 2 protein [Flavobacterium sp.]|nr:glycosyltransferase family 2 protein [Flavobacterium sp.]
MVSISVIIPVFNSDKHLAICIESLLCQTFTDFELIFINDGSTDSSQNIIQSYQKNNSKIHLLNQENKGVSVARNNGIEFSKGTFLCFVDSDDYVEKDFLKILYNEITENNCEIITSNFISEQDGIIKNNKPLFEVNKLFFKEEIKSKIIPFFIENDAMNTACNKIYSSKLIKNNSIQFPAGVSMGEDGLFNIQAFNKANAVFFIDYNGYYYREVANSATRNSVSKDYFKSAIESYFLDVKEKYEIDIDSKNFQKLKSIRLIDMVCSLIHIYLRPNPETSFSFKYKYVKKMIYDKNVQFSIKNYWNETIKNKTKYQQFILNCIRHKSIFFLVLATNYSNLRSK